MRTRSLSIVQEPASLRMPSLPSALSRYPRSQHSFRRCPDQQCLCAQHTQETGLLKNALLHRPYFSPQAHAPQPCRTKRPAPAHSVVHACPPSALFPHLARTPRLVRTQTPGSRICRFPARRAGSNAVFTSTDALSVNRSKTCRSYRVVRQVPCRNIFSVFALLSQKNKAFQSDIHSPLVRELLIHRQCICRCTDALPEGTVPAPPIDGQASAWPRPPRCLPEQRTAMHGITPFFPHHITLHCRRQCMASQPMQRMASQPSRIPAAELLQEKSACPAGAKS